MRTAAAVDLPANVWTPIALRPREGYEGGMLEWLPLPDAPIGVTLAHKLMAAGQVVMASRHTTMCVELVVRPANDLTATTSLRESSSR